MSDTVAPLSIDSAADHVLSLLGNDEQPATETPIENLSDEARADRIAEEISEEGAKPNPEVETSEQEDEPEVPAIDPPVSWNAEAKERFKALPPELQKYWAERESERESGINKTQREAAEARKAAESERTAVQQERQAYSQRLTQLIDTAQTMDPVIAEGRKTDWAKAHAEDPLGAPAKYFAWQQREMQIQQMTQQRDQIAQMQKAEQLKSAEAKLTEVLKEEWTNTDKRKTFQSRVKKVLEDAGYSASEYQDTTDARALLIAHKAALYDELMAQQATIAEKKKQTPAPKTVLRSQSPDTADKSDKEKQALKRLKSLSRLDDQAALIASLIS